MGADISTYISMNVTKCEQIYQHMFSINVPKCEQICQHISCINGTKCERIYQHVSTGYNLININLYGYTALTTNQQIRL